METGVQLVPTKCTPLCIDNRPPFQFKVHHSDAVPLPTNTKQHKLTKSNATNANVESTRPELEMKRARYEVMKFSASNLAGREREEADVALAVSLGAIPPKKEYVNYKELLQKRNKSKEIADVKPHSIAKLKANLLKGKDKNKKTGGKKKSKVKGKEKRKVTILQSYGKPSKEKKRRKLE